MPGFGLASLAGPFQLERDDNALMLTRVQAVVFIFDGALRTIMVKMLDNNGTRVGHATREPLWTKWTFADGASTWKIKIKYGRKPGNNNNAINRKVKMTTQESYGELSQFPRAYVIMTLRIKTGCIEWEPPSELAAGFVSTWVDRRPRPIYVQKWFY